MLRETPLFDIETSNIGSDSIFYTDAESLVSTILFDEVQHTEPFGRYHALILMRSQCRGRRTGRTEK